MSTLVERMALGHGCQMTDTETGEILACSECKLQAAVVADWLTGEQAAEVAARAHYIASEDDREWAAGAWDDMGGSEPTYERAAAVIAMREALAALAAHAKGETDE